MRSLAAALLAHAPLGALAPVLARRLRLDRPAARRAVPWRPQRVRKAVQRPRQGGSTAAGKERRRAALGVPRGKITTR